MLAAKAKARPLDFSQREVWDALAVAERALAGKQAVIDRLMLEYCPDEMNEVQVANWAAHQVPADPEAEAQIETAVRSAVAGTLPDMTESGWTPEQALRFIESVADRLYDLNADDSRVLSAIAAEVAQLEMRRSTGGATQRSAWPPTEVTISKIDDVTLIQRHVLTWLRDEVMLTENYRPARGVVTEILNNSPGGVCWEPGFTKSPLPKSPVSASAGWISVNDRLPAEDQNVLAFGTDSDEPVIAFLLNGFWCYSESPGTRVDVQQWQPLPQPPVSDSNRRTP